MTSEVDILFSDPEPRVSAPIKPPAFVKRFFYRCADCLTVAATMDKLPEARANWGGNVPTAKCGACDGAIEFMGATEKSWQNYTTREVGIRPICDGKCISATGPNCECQCGGVNHGSGMVVPVYEYQGIPRLKVVDPKAADKAGIYRALLESVNAAWERKYRWIVAAKYQRYLDSSEFQTFLESGWKRSAINVASAMRSHAGRNKKLSAILAELGR